MCAYISGTSTRRVDDLVRALGCDSGVSKSTVSRICTQIDEEVASFRARPLDHIAMAYIYLDATYIKARHNHRIVSRAVIVATSVTANGDREVLGIDVGDSEDEVFWTAFLRTLKDRGLAGVRLVISDAHAGLKAAIVRVFSGATWQRCKVHTTRNVLAAVGAAHKEMVAATVRTIFAQTDAAATQGQLREVVGLLEAKFPDAAATLRLRRTRRHRLRHLPPRPLAQDRLHQPPRTDQQGDQTALQRRGHLPRRQLGDPPRRSRPRRTTQRMGRQRTPLPLRSLHGPDRPTPGGDHQPRHQRTHRRIESAANTESHALTSTTPQDATMAG